MKDVIKQYTFLLYTILVGVAGAVRVVWPDLVVPSDEEIRAICDAVAVIAAPVVGAWLFYKSDTSSNSFKEYSDNVK